jgi:hypothetical protein
VTAEARSRHDRRRGRRQPLWRRPLVRLAALVAAALLLLLLGISVGRALEDGPSPGGIQTNVRTLDPRPLPAVTVTVTE